MIKSFSYEKDKERSLSEHFKVKEFCDEKRDIILDTDLIFFLECIFARCHASKITINSGYRSPEEDIKVGGNGSGFHTKGKAVDFKVYDSKNKLIESKYICCIAQELGLKGIAMINKNSTHIDLRSDADPHYFGDETKGNSSVTTNFYSYFNLTLGDILQRIDVIE